MCLVFRTFARLLVCLTNVALIVLGVALLGLGAFGGHINTAVDVELLSPGMTCGLIVAGVLLAVIGLLGCVAGWLRWRWPLRVYSAVLAAAALALVVGACYGLNKGSEEADALVKSKREEMLLGLDGYMYSEEARKHVDYLQNFFECCGVDAPSDWRWRILYPPSCCPKNKVLHGQNITQPPGPIIPPGFNFTRANLTGIPPPPGKFPAGVKLPKGIKITPPPGDLCPKGVIRDKGCIERVSSTVGYAIRIMCMVMLALSLLLGVSAALEIYFSCRKPKQQKEEVGEPSTET